MIRMNQFQYIAIYNKSPNFVSCEREGILISTRAREGLPLWLQSLSIYVRDSLLMIIDRHNALYHHYLHYLNHLWHFQHL